MSKPEARRKAKSALTKRDAPKAMAEAISKLNPAERAAVRRASGKFLDSVKTPKFEQRHADNGRPYLGVKGEPHTQEFLLLDIFGTADETFKRAMTNDLAHAFKSASDHASAGELENAIALVRAIGPRNEAEALLAVQMASVHNALIFAAGQLRRAQMLDHQDSAATILNRLARTSCIQHETLKKLRSTGEQIVHVQHQHVTVNDGGQAIVAGQVAPGGGGTEKESNQPHEPSSSRQRSPAMLSQIQAQPATLPSAGGSRLECLPMPRRAGRRAER